MLVKVAVLLFVVAGIAFVALDITGGGTTVIKLPGFEIVTGHVGLVLIAMALLFYWITLRYARD